MPSQPFQPSQSSQLSGRQPSAGRAPFTRWLRDHATTLTTLDPDAPLDDLEPLRDLIGDARVVGVGENSHFIHEFALVRRRLLRFLVERCGFTVLAFEYGFSEAFALDTWVRGAGRDDDLERISGAALPIGVQEPLRSLRLHNRTAARPVRFAGVDIPAAGGSLLPALHPVADHLREADPEALPLAETAIGIAGRFAGESAAAAAPAWARLDATEQDALTAALARLLIRFRATEPLQVARTGRYAYEVALRRLEAASQADYTVRAMAALFAGTGLTTDASSRETYMAGSVLWHLDRAEPDARVVLMAHNAHLQKEPAVFDGYPTALPMGQFLHRALGDDYFALGVSCVGGRTAEMRLEESARFGFTVDDTVLEAPEQGSIEAAFAEAVPARAIGLAGLRSAPRGDGMPDRTRIQSAYVHTPVADAFDGMLCVPSSRVADGIDI
ncbi:erythromycin esterase family protein [Streptomyces rectiverticillatus]|uniref:erythromycin esterase family protein n=1 Tax=Streptomyces rectiverticillatus TaxID=173860 RepID=UPI0015C2D64B|nr:erythromycin esterase family protein [Streptomyces rectiverticillatus]QLE75069.1 erythromycin esterase family protein [Streptomyces rectiverticillatus]